MVCFNDQYEADSKKVFFVSISYVPFLLNNCKAKLVVTVS